MLLNQFITHVFNYYTEKTCLILIRECVITTYSVFKKFIVIAFACT